jgi:hypothetical protein
LTKGKFIGANIYIDGTDDATTNENGQFSFSTTATGNQVLIASFLVYETSKTTINVADFQNKTIVLLESSNTLDAVVISVLGNR